jgi:hypothetical protein
MINQTYAFGFLPPAWEASFSEFSVFTEDHHHTQVYDVMETASRWKREGKRAGGCSATGRTNESLRSRFLIGGWIINRP